MLAFIFSQDEDANVYDWQLTAIFMLKIVDKATQYKFDFVEHISQALVEQLSNFKDMQTFRYSAYLFHLILYQNYQFLQLDSEGIENRMTNRIRGFLVNFKIPCDYFFGAHFTIVRLHGFVRELFMLPKVLTPRVIALEVAHQLSIIDNNFGSKKNTPWTKAGITIRRKEIKYLL